MNPLDRLIDTSVRHRAAVLALTALFVLLAGRYAQGLTFDAFPDLTNVQVQVLTTSPGMGSEEVELLVTMPLERSLGGVPGLAQIRSISRPGISAITLVFEDGSDLWLARQQVKERVDTARGDIPDAAGTPELAPPTTGLGEVYQFTVSSDRLPRPELYRVFERDIAPRLRAVPGVVEVNAWGAGAPQLDVHLDPYALAARGLDLLEVEDRVSQALGLTSGGARVHGAEQDTIRGRANPDSPEALAELSLSDDPDHPIRLGDVATIERAGALTVGMGSADGTGEALFAVVQLLAGADARSTVAGVAEAVEVIRPSLPDGTRMSLVYDREKLVGNTLHTVGRSLLEGGGLVILVLLVILGDLRAGLVVSSVIPLAMLGALAGLRALGFSGNLMSLGAIDFGLVVDGTVVVVESLVAMRLVEGADRAAAVSERTRSVARPVLFAVGVLLLVYVPVIAMVGVEGRLFRPMAVTVLLALGTALLLTFTYVPALASYVVHPHGDHQTPLVAALARTYARVLDATLAHPVVVAVSAIALFSLSIAAGSQLGVLFVPRLEEGDLVLQTERLPSISPEEALRGATRIERALLDFPEIERIATRSGSPAVATDPMGLGESDILIRLAPRDAWTTATTTEGLVNALAAAVRAVDPAPALTFTQPIEMRFNELLEGIPSDVGVELYGTDLDALLLLGREVADRLERIEGAADVRAPSMEGLPTVDVEVDPARAAALGVAPADVLALVEAVQIGREAGMVLRGQFLDAVVLKLDLPAEVSIADIPLRLPNGHTVPLSEVATVRAGDAPATIRRQAGTRRVVVQANVRGRDLGSFVQEARAAVKDLPLPDGSWIEWSGKYEQLAAAANRTAVLVPLVLLAILGVLRAAFGAMRPALLIFLNVPMATSGGLLILWAGGLPISMSAVVGFIALAGIAVMNGIVLIGRVLELAVDHGPAEAARMGALERFRPVVMTATVAGLGFVPMALAHGVGSEVQRPLATVVIGGLLTATALTLLVLPALSARFLRAPGPPPT